MVYERGGREDVYRFEMVADSIVYVGEGMEEGAESVAIPTPIFQSLTEEFRALGAGRDTVRRVAVSLEDQTFSVALAHRLDVVSVTLLALRLTRSERPDVLVLDMQMPDLSGVEVARRLHEEEHPARIIALSAHADRAYVEGLMNVGAAGYITKEEPIRVVVEAVRSVARGGRRWFVQPPPGEPETENPLTEREEEVLRLMARGQSNEEIAERLYLAENTVRNHITSIYAKLGVHSARAAVAWAWKHGFGKSEK